jgi:hypothetical protein
MSCISITAFGGALAVVIPDTLRTVVTLEIVCGFGVGGDLAPAATIAITVM